MKRKSHPDAAEDDDAAELGADGVVDGGVAACEASPVRKLCYMAAYQKRC